MEDPLRDSATRALVSALREFAWGQEIDETLQLAIDVAASLIRGCDSADLMFFRRGGTVTPVATDPLAVSIDQVQEEVGEGPCITAAQHETIVHTRDITTDDRWPAFSEGAARLGVRSVLSYQLSDHSDPDNRFGALNLYGMRPEVFDEDAIALGEAFAAHCSTVLAAAIEREGLRAALESRDLIGQAKGILMSQHKLTASAAFDLLRRASQSRNIKLRELAEHVVETGSLE